MKEIEKVEKTVDKLGFLDNILAKVVSRKLMVFMISTGLLWADKVTSDDFVFIACCYIGVQGAIDFFKLRN